MRLGRAAAAPGERWRLALGSSIALLAGTASLVLAPDWPIPVLSVPPAAMALVLMPEPPPMSAPVPQLEAPPVVTAPVEPPGFQPAPVAPAAAPTKPVLPRPPVMRGPAAPPIRPVRNPAVAPDATAPAAAPSPAAVSQPTAAEISAFQSGMRRAVQEALVYPPAARIAGQSGDVRVAFDFLDGAVSNAALSASSGLAILDHAALVTVQAAHYPPPPAPMMHKAMHLSVLVQFTAQGG